MATKRARVNKTLEKAKKLIAKKGKKKTTKRAYPEGQNPPQSKAYNIENDKVVPAKRTGYRFTKEGAKKLRKQPNDRPTADEIEKYRNETFKVKGKVNKSGPKGVGDGSFRYLYIESRADKSDLNKARKLEHGGETKNTWGVFYNGKLMFTEKSLDDAGKSAKMLKSEVDMPFAVSVEKIEENKMAKGGKTYYHVLQEGDQGQIASYGYYNDKDEAEKESTRLQGFYPNSYFYVYSSPSTREPEIVNMAKGGELELLVDSRNGIYVPKVFVQNYDLTKFGIDEKSAKEYKEILSNPKHEDYHEAFDDLMSEAITKDGETLTYADGDLYLVPKGYEYDDFFAKGGEMFIDLKSGDFRNQILFDPKEVREFQKYVFSYYGKNGTFVDVMEEGIPATTGEVLKAVSQYLAYLSSPKKSTDVTWGNGDSFDREIVRDIIKYNRNPRATVEYPFLIKDMKKTPILEYGGILQPMIGGVNADPRFDIYNTTMFAEKGAEVPEGDEYAKGGMTSIYEIGVRKKGKPGMFVVSVRAKDEEAALKEFNKQNSLLPGAENFKVVGVYKTARRRMEDGGEMAKGGKTHEQGYDDREDERLAMRHGKIASKDFVGSHHRREHSRRDDARFETRKK